MGAVFNFTVTPDSQIVQQGSGGNYTIDISNPNNYQVVITTLEILDNAADIRTDLQDKALNPVIIGGSCRRGTVLAARVGACDIRESFSTQDTRVPDPDVQPGVWFLQTHVVANEVGNINNAFGPKITETVTVSDVAQVPEPSTALCLVTGALALILGVARRR